MTKVLLFGGRERPVEAPRPNDDAELIRLLGWLSWKYVTPDPTFKPYDIDNTTELSEDVAHWAGKVWIHENEMPGDLRKFDLTTLEEDYRRHIGLHGAGILDVGLSLEEAWASQQLHDGTPYVLLLNRRYADQPLDRIAPKRLVDAQDLVWLLASMSVSPLGESFVRSRSTGFNILVTNGSIGHTIHFNGLNGLSYQHPRGDAVGVGWFSFQDPWPARSLLAWEKGWGVRVLEDVTYPPNWLISPSDLNRVIVGMFLPVDWLSGLRGIFAELDLAKSMNAKSGLPLWTEDPSTPEELFPFTLAGGGGNTPLTGVNLFGLGRIALFHRDLDMALELFEEAYVYDRTAGGVAAALLAEHGYESAAKVWSARVW